MSELGERLLAALTEHGNTLPALQHLMAEAWDEGWQKAHTTDDPPMAGIFSNPYRSAGAFIRTTAKKQIPDAPSAGAGE